MFKEVSRESCSISGRSAELLLQSEIQAQTNFMIEFLKVPNPYQVCTVDMNEIHIQVFNTTQRQIVSGLSFYLTNRAAPIAYLSYENPLKVNNDTMIQITRGTFSGFIQVQTANNTPFSSNFKLQIAGDGFQFLPAQFVPLYGDNSSQFRLGVDGNAISQIYTFSLRKYEKGDRTSASS